MCTHTCNALCTYLNIYYKPVRYGLNLDPHPHPFLEASPFKIPKEGREVDFRSLKCAQKKPGTKPDFL